MSEWAEVTIGDICTRVVSGGTPLTSKHEYYLNGNIPWLKTKEVNQCRIYSTENHITQLGLENSSAKLIPRNSVTVAMYGDGQTAGRVGLTKIPLATNQACCNLIIDATIADAEFVFYHLFGAYDELVARKTGSGQQNLNAQLIKAFEISLPELPEQKVIAAVLSSLDDKIDLLHRQNSTLEAMAATLFRQWFVEEAQEDWREVRLGDYFPVVTGKKDANFSTDDGEYPFFTCSQSAIKAPSCSFEGAAILLSGNGDFNIKRYIGKFEAYQRTYVLIPYDVKYFSFLYTLMKFYLLEITSGYQGSVINFITKGMITEFKFRLPDEHINIDEKLAQFNELYEKIDSNNSQIQTLEKLRDTLLPKLMSGEVRVV